MHETDELLKEIKAKRYKKDPFGKNYVQHALSELKVGDKREGEEHFDGLATDLKIRSEIINSQLKFLTDKVNQVSKQDIKSSRDELPIVVSIHQDIDDVASKKMETLEMMSNMSASELQEYCTANLITKIPWIDSLVASISGDRKKAHDSLLTDLKNCDKNEFYTPKSSNGISIFDEIDNEVRDYFAAQKSEEKENNMNFKQKILPFLKLVEPFAIDDVPDELSMKQEKVVAFEQMRYDDSTVTDNVDDDIDDSNKGSPRAPKKKDVVWEEVKVEAKVNTKISGLKLTQQNNKRQKGSPTKSSSRLDEAPAYPVFSSTKDNTTHISSATTSTVGDTSLPNLDDLRHNHQRIQQELIAIRFKRKKKPVVFVTNWKENNITESSPNIKNPIISTKSVYNVYHTCTDSFMHLDVSGADSELNRFIMAYPATIAVPTRNHLKIENCKSLFFGIKACLHCWFTHINVQMEASRNDENDDMNITNLPIEQIQFDDFFEHNNIENDETIDSDGCNQGDHEIDNQPLCPTVNTDTMVVIRNHLFYPNVMETEEHIVDNTLIKKSESRLLTRLNLDAALEESDTMLRTNTTVTPSITVSMLQKLLKKRLSNRRKTTIDLTTVADTLIEEGDEAEAKKITKRAFISTILLADDYNRRSKSNQMSLEPARGYVIDVTIEDNEL